MGGLNEPLMSHATFLDVPPELISRHGCYRIELVYSNCLDASVACLYCLCYTHNKCILLDSNDRHHDGQQLLCIRARFAKDTKLPAQTTTCGEGIVGHHYSPLHSPLVCAEYNGMGRFNTAEDQLLDVYV